MTYNVLSLHQPWAWFVVHGFKQWETRSWPSNSFGPLLIHATKKVCPVGRDLYYKVRTEFGDKTFLPHHPPPFGELPRGAIVGQVQFRCCHNAECLVTRLETMLGDFSEGRWFWGFKEATHWPVPISERGYQRIWKWEQPISSSKEKET